MLLLASLIFSLLLTYYLHDHIKNHAKLYYIGSIIIVLITIGLDVMYLINKFQLQGFLYTLARISRRGILAGALFILVMFAGALNSKWTLTRRLMKNRAELAIIASILMMAHGFIYTIGFLLYIKPILAQPESPIPYILICITGIIAFLLMIPLFITSFKSIKSRMGLPKWRRLQKWSYVFYFLFYAHVAVMFLRHGKIELNFIIYTIIFGLYTFLRLQRYMQIKKRKQSIPTKID